MEIGQEKTETGELLFYKEFDDVEEGEYQYKFRLGQGDWWVLDETAETATDDAGNRNNIIIVTTKPISEQISDNTPSVDSPKKTAESAAASAPHHTDVVFEATGAPQIQGASIGDLKTEDKDEKEISKDEPAAKASGLVPVPSTVVEKVPDAKQPQYGDVEAHSLHEDASKRAQDAHPDAEYDSPSEGPQKVQESSSPGFHSIPALVVEKTDNEPSHGDDFGEEATSAQKLAHEIRAADAEPDHVIITPESGYSQPLSSENPEAAEALVGGGKDIDTSESGRAPLFAHEAFEEDKEDEEDGEEEEEAPLLPHERSHEHSEATDEEGFPDEPRAIEGGIPLFVHEITDNDRMSPILRRESNKRSTTSLHSLDDVHEEQDFNDPSIEPFPTRREEIFVQVAAIENRLPEDETIGTGSPYDLSPIGSMACSSMEPGSPLNPIEEDSGDEEEMDLPSPAVSYAKPPVASAEVPEQRIDQAEEEVRSSDGSPDNKEFSKAEATDPAGPSRGPLTPPLTPKENKSRDQEDSLNSSVAEASTPTKTRTLIDETDEYTITEDLATPIAKNTEPFLQAAGVLRSAKYLEPSTSLANNRPVTPSSIITPSQNKQEGFFRAFFRVVFGSWMMPLGRFFTSFFGGKRNATGVAVVFVAFAAYYFIGAS